ncbi:hypothetical protein HNQ59_003785 [Chitinivorax tropicus]|uniref:Uncharacterized protein n=1 Tax=Chitinivorax tropicus TaxID=714531 RepID=A0A840MSS3_9PROT|nr:hypothetical protein [Chitinivorax tropicus]MBB5020465.1 hypothetical protein [Chitinivorax tropicus]
MGSFVEFNDSLVISIDQGFPVEVFDINRHQTKPVTLADVGERIFTFYDKANARIYQLDPVRVYLYQYLQNRDGEGRWLAWGQILIQSQTIAKNTAAIHQGADNISDPHQWVTSGTYRMLKVFDPDYQRIFTRHETPAGMSYFDDQ